MRVINRRQLNAFAGDIVPDIKFGPVGNREYAEVFTLSDARVVKIPELRTLRARLPLTEAVAVREYALFGARFFLISTCAANHRVEAVGLDGFEQCDCLVGVATLKLKREANRAIIARVIEMTHDQIQAVLLD